MFKAPTATKPQGLPNQGDNRNQGKALWNCLESAQPGSRAPLVSTMNGVKEKFNPEMKLFNKEQISKWHMKHSTDFIVGKKVKYFLIYKPLWQKLIWINSNSFSQETLAFVSTCERPRQNTGTCFFPLRNRHCLGTTFKTLRRHWRALLLQITKEDRLNS